MSKSKLCTAAAGQLRAVRLIALREQIEEKIEEGLGLDPMRDIAEKWRCLAEEEPKLMRRLIMENTDRWDMMCGLANQHQLGW